MSAQETQHFEEASTVKPADKSMAAAFDNTLAYLAGDSRGSVFPQNVPTAKEITAQHLAVGNLPNIKIVDSGDLSFRLS